LRLEAPRIVRSEPNTPICFLSRPPTYDVETQRRAMVCGHAVPSAVYRTLDTTTPSVGDGRRCTRQATFFLAPSLACGLSSTTVHPFLPLPTSCCRLLISDSLLESSSTQTALQRGRGLVETGKLDFTHMTHMTPKAPSFAIHRWRRRTVQSQCHEFCPFTSP